MGQLIGRSKFKLGQLIGGLTTYHKYSHEFANLHCFSWLHNDISLLNCINKRRMYFVYDYESNLQ